MVQRPSAGCGGGGGVCGWGAGPGATPQTCCRLSRPAMPNCPCITPRQGPSPGLTAVAGEGPVEGAVGGQQAAGVRLDGLHRHVAHGLGDDPRRRGRRWGRARRRRGRRGRGGRRRGAGGRRRRRRGARRRRRRRQHQQRVVAQQRLPGVEHLALGLACGAEAAQGGSLGGCGRPRSVRRVPLAYLRRIPAPPAAAAGRLCSAAWPLALAGGPPRRRYRIRGLRLADSATTQ